MSAQELASTLLGRLKENSGFDEHRPYIGMSRIGECRKRIYTEFIDGVAATLDNHVGAWLGYTMEAAVLELLGKDVQPGRELTAFDGLVRGHTDGEWRGELIEVKSTTNRKLLERLDDRRVDDRHYQQVTAYMHFGRWRRCSVIYVPRDFGKPTVFGVNYDPNEGARIEARFAEIVTHVRNKRPPRCECGRCRN